MGDNSSPAFMPLVPGMRSTHYEQMAKTHFRRGHLLERMAVGKLTSTEEMPPPPPSAFQSVVSAATAAKCQELSRPATTTQAMSSYPSPPQPEVSRLPIPSSKYRVDNSKPAWITHDRLVLRFFAYFNEPVELADGRTESRVRRVVVCFYLSDRSISISEPRVTNSGILQGEFMRRTVVRKTGNRSFPLPRENISDDFYSPEDFRIGGELRLYGRTIHIVDCDAATRSFYSEALGETLETPRVYPDESHSRLDEVDELKNQLRDRTRAIGASKAEATRKFHNLSQKVLRFYASWHDDHPLYPETRHFVLHYYLTDDTVEIIEARNRNRDRGRGHFSVLLSRRKLARESDTQRDDHDGESFFLTDRDLRCGEWITVFSRRLLLQDCDAFTRDYYLETHGVTQEKFDAPTPQAPEAIDKWKPFRATQEAPGPWFSNGRGTSGYSANNNNSCMQSGLVAPIPGGQSCGRPAVTALCRDDDLDGKQLRFRARFQGLPHGAVNAEREFVLTYFLEDETLAVFEPRVRNSGVLGGRFLDRARFRKDPKLTQLSTTRDEAIPMHYLASDMYVGAVLVFEFSPHQRLELLEADSQTLRFCESHPEVFRFSDSSAVLALVAKFWMNRPVRVDLRREWRQLDRSNSHFVSIDAMRSVLSQGGLTSNLNEQQLITLFRRFTNDTDNNQSQNLFFGYDDFCDILAALVAKLPSCEESGDTTRSISWKLMKIPRVRRLLAYAGSNPDFVSVSALLRVMADRAVSLSKSEIDVLTSTFAVGNGSIDIHRLCDYVFQLPSDQQDAVDSKDIDFAFDFSNNGGDKALPPDSTRSTERSISKPDKVYAPAQSARKTVASHQTLQPLTDPRVVSLLQRVFGARKYQLRKALRERDVEKSGQLGEDEFMDALLSVASQLSDDDSYLLADAFFPTNNCHVDYSLLLDSAFRS
ncbi:hypothetical protein V7S43_006923 [Phytophthora oleae]|uniref:DM10 domain-containing protein n=1 Tax=Phytophthora oleae TaxID=2107226 RepID=A0ABD3FP18_9STRA